MSIECPKKLKERISKLRKANSVSQGDRKLQRTDKILKYLTNDYTKPTKALTQPEYDALKNYSDTGRKVRPPKPTQADRVKALKAKLEERAIDLSHEHKIVFRYAKSEVYDIPNLHTAGSYWKYWLLNAKKVNGNGWGVSDKTIQQNIARFIGKPFVVTAKEWFDNSEYGTYEHPYVPTNHLPTIFNHQAKFTVGIIEDVYKDKNDDYYATIRPLPKFASRTPPPFCSPAIFQLDPHEPENAISKWEALHLAGLDRDPAYGAAIAMLKGTCIGTGDECKVQFHSARQYPSLMINNRIKSALLHPQSLQLERALRDITPPDHMESLGGSQFISTDGELLGKADEDHRVSINQALHKHGGFEHLFSDEYTPSDRLDEFMKMTGVARIYTTNTGSLNLNISHPLSDAQKNKLQDLITDRNIQPEDIYLELDHTMRGKPEHHILRQIHPGYYGAKQRTAAYKIEQPAEVRINPEHGRTIADAYDAMKHEPNKPDVKEAYDSLINETGDQFKQLINGGLKITKMKPNDPNPYPTSKEMHKDIEENNHLYYFPTEQGFGQGENNSDHPMMRPTEFKHDGQPMLANDVFRIVHDINGHHLGGKTTFGPKGEHQAFIQHSRMYSPIAKKALFTETAGQNNWVNFSRSHGEKNRADPKNTTFAEQKAGLLPDEIINGKFHI